MLKPIEDVLKFETILPVISDKYSNEIEQSEPVVYTWLKDTMCIAYKLLGITLKIEVRYDNNWVFIKVNGVTGEYFKKYVMLIPLGCSKKKIFKAPFSVDFKLKSLENFDAFMKCMAYFEKRMMFLRMLMAINPDKEIINNETKYRITLESDSSELVQEKETDEWSLASEYNGWWILNIQFTGYIRGDSMKLRVRFGPDDKFMTALFLEGHSNHILKAVSKTEKGDERTFDTEEELVAFINENRVHSQFTLHSQLTVLDQRLDDLLGI